MPTWTSTQRLLVEALRETDGGSLDLGGLQKASGLRALALVRAIEELEREGTISRGPAGPRATWRLVDPAAATMHLTRRALDGPQAVQRA